MANEIETKNYLEEIDQLHLSSDTFLKEKISSLYSLFKRIINEVLVNNEQYFSNDFAKLIYISDKHSFPNELKFVHPPFLLGFRERFVFCKCSIFHRIWQKRIRPGLREE